MTIYIVGDFRSEAADGLAEFNYQNVKLLNDVFRFEFIEFSTTHSIKHYQLEKRENIKIHCFGIKGLLPLRLPSTFSRWLKKLDRRHSLFHLSHIWNVRNYLIAKTLVSYTIPYLITPHDSYVYSRTYNRGRPFLKKFYRFAFVYIFDKYVLDHANIVHALTAECVSSLQRITNTPISIVENQIKDTQIPLDIHLIKPQICFIGRFNIIQKGIDLSLEAFKSLKLTNVGLNVKFVLVGPADDEALKIVHAMCDELNITIGQDLILAGKVSESQRNTILGESKAYIQLSRHEGFGLSVGQALSSYKPVIVSEGIPIGQTIVRHQAGFIVRNMEEASAALVKLFAMSEEDYMQLAMNARHCYETEFHPAVIKPKLIALYQSAVN